MIVELLLALSLSQGLTTLAPGQSSGVKAPLITPDANVVAHVWFPKAIADTKANAWSATGAPPISKSTAFKVARYGGGPTTTSDYWKLGTGNDVLDFTGDFTICAVFTGPAGTVIRSIFTNGTVSTSSGYGIEYSSSERLEFYTFGAAASNTQSQSAATVNAGLNVACVGRTGTDQKLKLNGATTVTTAGAKNANCNATNAGCVAYLAYNSRNTIVMPGQVFEFYATTTAWNETDIAALQTAVMAKFK